MSVENRSSRLRNPQKCCFCLSSLLETLSPDKALCRRLLPELK